MSSGEVPQLSAKRGVMRYSAHVRLMVAREPGFVMRLLIQENWNDAQGPNDSCK